MKSLKHIVLLSFLLSILACGRMPRHTSEIDLQEAQIQYDSGLICLQRDSLLQGLPYFFRVAEKLEVLPEDMDSAAMQLTSQAYVQMAHVFKLYIEDNAEIDALKRALFYQRIVNDSSLAMSANLELANAYFCIMEHDSAAYYLDMVKPYLDTVSGNFEDYFSAQRLVSDLYYDLHEFDSCFLVMQELIAFKTRRGIDTKNDSVNLGIAMFHSPYCLKSKPYLLKALDSDIDDMKLGAIMSLLARIYEAEGNADSVAFCQKYHASYVKAETDRVSDGLLVVKQYEQFKDRRDARLQALLEQKATRKRMAAMLWIGLALMVSVVVVAAIVRLRKRRNASFAAGWAQFEQSDIFVRIRERLAADAPKISSKNVEDFSHLALSQADFAALKDAVDLAFGGFATRLAARYPDLSPADLNACCLALTGLSHAEMAVLQGVKYNSFTNRITKIKKILGSEESLSACLKNMLKEG